MLTDLSIRNTAFDVKLPKSFVHGVLRYCENVLSVRMCFDLVGVSTCESIVM